MLARNLSELVEMVPWRCVSPIVPWCHSYVTLCLKVGLGGHVREA